MILESLKAVPLSIPFKTVFKHASAERSATQTVWVEARSRSGLSGCGEGCPREYVSGESLNSSLSFISAHGDEWLDRDVDLDTLADWVARHRTEIDRHPAAWTAMELAVLDLLGKEQSCSVEALLGLPDLSGTFQYTAVLGDASPRHFDAQLDHYLRAGFRKFKIKLSGDRGRDVAKVRALSHAGIDATSVRADANNLWADADTVIDHVGSFADGLFALEEPLAVGDKEGMRRIACALGIKIILDESVLRVDQLDRYGATPEHWIVNLRVSKMGGLLRSLQLVRAARDRGLPLIIGAQVGETSLLTRAGLLVAQSARDILLAQEGAFGTHLLASDVVDVPLVFGQGGVLDVALTDINSRPGFGLRMSQLGSPV